MLEGTVLSPGSRFHGELPVNTAAGALVQLTGGRLRRELWGIDSSGWRMRAALAHAGKAERKFELQSLAETISSGLGRASAVQ